MPSQPTLVKTRTASSSGLLLVSLLLASCSSTPEQRQPQVSVPEPVAVEQQIALTPLELLLLQAEDAEPAEAAALLLEAATLSWQAGDNSGTEELLASIDSTSLPPAGRESLLLLQAELAAASKDHGRVLELLREGSFRTLESLPADQRIRYHTLRADALLGNGSLLPSALERIQLDALLPASLQTDNHDLIWQALTRLPENQLQRLAATAVNYETQGWYRLALTSKSFSADLDRQLIELRRWRSAWARHPAALVLPREFDLAETMARERPQQLALLLPLETPAGAVVRDAFMSAYFNLRALGGQVPEVRFYDSNAASDIIALHRQARAEGAQMIIGPLLRQHVATLQAEPDLGVTTLALNNIEGQAPASPLLFQFALAPEDEARQLANKAWRDGHRRVAILSPPDEPDNDFFARKRDSFIAEWQTLGGQVATRDTYADNYTSTISDMLELDASTARVENLRRVLGRPIFTEQRRRQDIDFIYLIALSAPARQIVPSLAYLYAGDIPVYASQDVWTGLPRPVEDRDLNGIVFGESPWLLGNTEIDIAQVRELFPQTSAQTLRLQAFGLDAFRLYPRLRLLQSSPDSRIPGATGTLRLGPNQTIERELTWATINAGLVIPQE